ISLLHAPPPPPRSPYTTLFRSPDSWPAGAGEPAKKWSISDSISRRKSSIKSPVRRDRAPDGPCLLHGIRNMCHLLSTSSDSSSRSEEHTSELQSRGHLVCRLLL